jgi:hypothetical protein
MKDVLSVEPVPKKQNGDILGARKELTFNTAKMHESRHI